MFAIDVAPWQTASMLGATSRSSVILGVFFASGATSLIYQVLWTRWFGLVFGNTTISVTLVLGAFMCGLALGSAIIARHVATMARPLRTYALCEAGIGAFALVFPGLLRGVESLYLLVDDGQGGASTQLAKLVLAFALLCIPTGLMGATLPLLAEHFRRHPRDQASWGVGMLYAANTIGAACGIVLSGFVLIELLGVTQTTLVAAAGNIVVATVAAIADRRRSSSAQAAPPPPVVVPSAQARRQAMWIGAVLAVTGGLALANEVLWTRLLSTFLGTSTYAFTTIVFTYLVGIAAGSALMSRMMRRVRDPRAALLVAVLLAGVLHTVSIEAFLYIATVDDLVRGRAIPLLEILGLYVRFSLLLVPTAIASGACFPLATRILNPNDNDAEGALVAQAYSANTWGSVVGSLVAGFVIAAWLDFEPSLRLIGLGYLVAALIGAAALRASSRTAVVLGVVLVVVGVATSVRWATRPTFVERFESHTPYKVLRYEPSSQGLTMVTELDDTRALLVNHHGMTVKVTDTKMMAHLPLFLIDKPADTLVICFGMGTTFRSAMSHGGNVTVVELVPGVASSFELFYDDAARLRADPRGKILVEDGRHFLMATPQRFDVITLDPPPPIDGEGVNNLYSVDFATLARDHLKPGGIVAHWMPMIGTGSGVDDDETMQMIMQSFAAAFPYTRAILGRNRVGYHMLGSLTPIVMDEATILARMEARPAAVRDMNELQAVAPSMLWSAAPYAVIEGAELTTDDRPLLEFSMLRGFKTMNGKVLQDHLWF